VFNKQEMNIVHIRLSHIYIDELLLPNVWHKFLCFLNQTNTRLGRFENVTHVNERDEFHNSGKMVNSHLLPLFFLFT
jgi:hypothetical protein